MSKTIKELAQDALDVQSACNLSGVIHAFSRTITKLRELLPGVGTDAINTHPICILWSDKIAALTGTQTIGHDNVSAAYDAIYKLIA